MDAGTKGVVWYGLRVLGDALFGVSVLALVFYFAGDFPGGVYVAIAGAVAGALVLALARVAEPDA